MKWQQLLIKGVKIEGVFVMNLFQEDDYTFGRIKVMPHSEIPLHPHENDCEWYLDEKTGDLINFCPKGKNHQFRNDTADTRYLLSIKKVV